MIADAGDRHSQLLKKVSRSHCSERSSRRKDISKSIGEGPACTRAGSIVLLNGGGKCLASKGGELEKRSSMKNGLEKVGKLKERERRTCARLGRGRTPKVT